MVEFLTMPQGTLPRVLMALGIGFLGHMILIQLRRITENLMKPKRKSKERWVKKFPKVVTSLTLITSVLTFIIYFGVLGFILVELGVPITAYFASASVIGLAVAFGSQGIVQDFVVGITLIFSDVLDVGDLIDTGGQTGIVRQVGLRYTILENAHGQQIFLANRNIGQINRYPDKELRVYVDLELPTGADDQLETELAAIAQGIRHEFPAIVLSEPKLSNPRAVGSERWEYLRVQFSVWPGHQTVVETNFKNRVLELIRDKHPDYPDWKLTVTTRGSL